MEYSVSGVTVRTGDWGNYGDLESYRNVSYGPTPRTPDHSDDEDDDTARRVHQATSLGLRSGENLVTSVERSFLPWKEDREVVRVEGTAQGRSWAQILRDGGQIVTEERTPWFGEPQKVTKIEEPSSCSIM